MRRAPAASGVKPFGFQTETLPGDLEEPPDGPRRTCLGQGMPLAQEAGQLLDRAVRASTFTSEEVAVFETTAFNHSATLPS